MPNCRIELSELEFSADKAERRIRQAINVLGEKVVLRMLAFAVFLLGAERKAIASMLSFPLGTLLSLLTRVGKVGLPAFEDRRRKNAQFRPVVEASASDLVVAMEDEDVVIGSDLHGPLRIPTQGVFQQRVILLSLVNGGALTTKNAAEMLGCTVAHVRILGRKMEVGGAESLLDRRRGQKQEYRITPEVKSELITQVAAHAMGGECMSSAAITASLNDRRHWQLAERTIRLHMQKLGLGRVAVELPKLVSRLKKGSRA